MYFSAAAEKGHDLANVHMGLMRRRGEDKVSQNAEKAIANFQKGAEGAVDVAIYQYGLELAAQGRRDEAIGQLDISANLGFELAKQKADALKVLVSVDSA